MGKFIDLTNQKFGRLTVINNTANTAHDRKWQCKCDCGNEIIVTTSNLKSGNTRSCGCLNTENIYKRGKFLAKIDQEKNLKEGTRLSQISSKKPHRNNKSGRRGVVLGKDGKWRALMNFKGTTVLDRRFKNKQDAINAREEAEEKYFKPILEKYKNSHSRQSD